MKTGVIVGGTGAQGASVVRHLASLNLYDLKVLTRNPTGAQALALSKLPNVTLVRSSPAGYDEESFIQAATNADFAFINTDGFSVGEVAEVYWGIRFWELSQRVGVKHFIYSSLDNLEELTEHKNEFRVGHYAGKARVVDYLKSQNSNPAKGTFWSVITSGPYIEMLFEVLAPRKSDDGTTALFTYPLGNGAFPLIHLDDIAKYAATVLSRPSEFAGHELHIASFHASGSDIATAFTRVTGQPARYIDIPVDTWLNAAFSHHARGFDYPIGREAYPKDMSAEEERFFLPLTLGENFRAWWNTYKHSGDNKGIVQRDYDMLDVVLPERVKSLEEWMRKVEYDGQKREVLKGLSDQLARSKAKE